MSACYVQVEIVQVMLPVSKPQTGRSGLGGDGDSAVPVALTGLGLAPGFMATLELPCCAQQKADGLAVRAICIVLYCIVL
jgi:hypothetical protein